MTARRSRYELSRAKQAALRLYGSYPNVVGISAGTKFKNLAATDNHAAIHFYVRQKTRPKRGKLLPRTVYGRFKNGKVNRKLRFATDVIEVGRVKTVCGAGSRISASIGLNRQNGTITFLFKNKAGPDKKYYAVSCAHVIGDINGPNGTPVTSDSECSQDATFATTIFYSTQKDEAVEYDIAVAEINPACLPLPDLEIAGTNTAIRSFMPKSRINPPLPVSCALPVSNAQRGVVSSEAGTVSVEYKKGTYEVQNAWMVKANKRVKEGDSGGIVYAGDVAIGVVFASSDTDDGWAWFHPLVDAFAYLQKNVSSRLACFDS